MAADFQRVPTSLVGRVLLSVWLLLCVAVLAFAFFQRGVHDMPVAATWFMMLLSAPIGFVAVALAGYGTSLLTEAAGLPYEPFVNFLPLWVVAVCVGYLQWFIVLPWLARKVLRVRSSL